MLGLGVPKDIPDCTDPEWSRWSRGGDRPGTQKNRNTNALPVSRPRRLDDPWHGLAQTRVADDSETRTVSDESSGSSLVGTAGTLGSLCHDLTLYVRLNRFCRTKTGAKKGSSGKISIKWLKTHEVCVRPRRGSLSVGNRTDVSRVRGPSGAHPHVS